MFSVDFIIYFLSKWKYILKQKKCFPFQRISFLAFPFTKSLVEKIIFTLFQFILLF